MNGLSAAQRNYDRELPDDLRTDDQIEQDAAERMAEQRAKNSKLIRDDAAWARCALRREEAARVAEHNAAVEAMKRNPLFEALFDASKWAN